MLTNSQVRNHITYLDNINQVQDLDQVTESEHSNLMLDNIGDISISSIQVDNLQFELYFLYLSREVSTDFWYKLISEKLFPVQFEELPIEVERDGLWLLENRLRRAIEDLPVENGIHHPIESIIAEAVEQKDTNQVLKLLQSIVLNFEQPTLSSSVLRCLSRLQIGTKSWRTQIIQSALTSNDLLIRDTAIQAAESWGGKELLQVLQNHSEPISWLRDYMQEVIEDLRR